MEKILFLIPPKGLQLLSRRWKLVSFLNKVKSSITNLSSNIKFDLNRNTINCDNGVLDFETGIFREQRIEDLCICSTNVNFIIEKGNQKLDEFDVEFSNIFPDPKNKQKCIDIFTSCLVGHIHNCCIIDVDLGYLSGKSTFRKLVRRTFGDYYGVNDNIHVTHEKRICSLQSTTALRDSSDIETIITDSICPIWFDVYDTGYLGDIFNERRKYELKFTASLNTDSYSLAWGDSFASKKSEFLYTLFNNANSFRYVKNVCNCDICKR